MDLLIKIGLTGGIGSGKSTVSKIFKEQYHIPIVDADIIAKQVVYKHKNIIEKVKYTFGERFIDLNGELNRKELGDYIFSHPKQKKEYEDIIIPYIKADIFDQIKFYEGEGEKFCIIDAPTLIENNLHKDMDLNILVWVDLEIQIKRVMSRDNFTREEAIMRIKSQMPLDEKRKYVDLIIDNSGSLVNIKNEAHRIIECLSHYKDLRGKDEGKKVN